MSKYFKYSILSVIAIIFACIILWFGFFNLIALVLNKNYSNKNIYVINQDNKYQYFVSFAKVVPNGFSFKIVNWTEEGKSSRVEHREPVILGYDPLRGELYIKYSGEIEARYKPVQSGFGIKIIKEGYKMSFKLPLSLSLLKTLINKDYPFAITNHIESLEVKSDSIQVFDLVDNEYLYDASHEYFKLTLNKRKFYTSLADFSENIPQRMDVIYSTQVNHSTPSRKLMLENLLHGFIWPFSMEGETKIYLITQALKLNELKNELEIGISYTPAATATHKFTPTIIYSHKIDGNNLDSNLKIDASLALKTGIYNSMIKIIQDIVTILPDNAIVDILQKLLIESSDTLTATNIENRGYDFKLECAIARRPDHYLVAVKDLSLLSGKTGIKLTNESKINIHDSKWRVKGLAVVSNFPKLADIILNRAYFFKAIEQNNKLKDKMLYIDATKHFLRTISDYPRSSSEDLSFNYEIDSANIAKSKIGSTKLEQLKLLYYLSLYEKALEQIQSGVNIGDDIQERIKVFAPELNQNQKQLLEQFLHIPLRAKPKYQQDTIQ